MRRLKICAMLLAVILGLGSFAPKLVAQSENTGKQESSNQKQKENRKSEENRDLRLETRDESSKPLGSYRVEFTATELDSGKKVNSRSYSLLEEQGIKNKLRIGARVPIISAAGNSSVPPQFQYLEVGVNIDCTVQERDGFVFIASTINISSVAEQHDEQTRLPVIRQMNSEVTTLLTPGKPTLISSMDDPAGKGSFQLEVTATKVK